MLRNLTATEFPIRIKPLSYESTIILIFRENVAIPAYVA